jgi:hypothetical protein
MNDPIAFHIWIPWLFWFKVYRIILTPHNPITICTVYWRYSLQSENAWKLVHLGYGIKKPGDAYDLEKGCRMALRSALRNISNKELRTMIWARYNQYFPVEKRHEYQMKQIRKSIQRINNYFKANPNVLDFLTDPKYDGQV